ncbi:MAG: tRNA (cytidine(34)-2'-O)-methyltransferase [Chlamydiae bacterium]|nr:tRNA (cytidine(34)-2'-O)-methyltransferase [Chlamydiota bacterium]
MEVVLFEPEIPANAGNVARTCVATGSKLTLIEPLGFFLSNRMLKRSGLDYWDKLDYQTKPDLESYLTAQKRPVYFFSSKATKSYTEIPFSDDDIYVFGSETKGLPPYLFDNYSERFYTLFQKKAVRCLNLSNTVAIVLYESWKHRDFC